MDPSVADPLRALVARLPGGGEARPGQVAMAEAVARAVASGRHLVVQAGTGTGKTLAYLVPAILSGRRTVVATATKALQDQLATKDLPFVRDHLGAGFSWAVLKGRSNYACLQRVAEVASGADQLTLDERLSVRDEIRRLAAWAMSPDAGDGDRAGLAWEPSARAWAAVSVSADQCPGATRCPRGEACLAEAARRRAAGADVIVVNQHLYGTHLAAGGVVLPDHEVLVVDEAHMLADIVSDTCGTEVGAGRFTLAARLLGAIVADEASTNEVEAAGAALAARLEPLNGRRLPAGGDREVSDALALGRSRLERASAVLAQVGADATGEAQARRQRARVAIDGLVGDIDAALDPPDDTVVWAEGRPGDTRLCLAPLDVAGLLAERLWPHRTAVLTSATLPPALAGSVGLPDGGFDAVDVGSPFDYGHQALLYCALHLPDPRDAAYEVRMHDELRALVAAAGGRTLALFTSWRAMQAAAEAVGASLPYTVYTQADLPKGPLIERFRADEDSCLFATVGFFQGVDVPGAALSLVTIDRIPFPRPDEPLLAARRERAGAAAFRTIDLPRAEVLLAQAAGRLVRTATDRGVVAVFDRRLGTAGYRWDLVRALPPMRRTRHRAEAEAFLASLR